MHWYLVHTQPRLERIALENLERQGYECYLPMRPAEKLRRGKITVSNTPLFPRYLFIHLGMDSPDKGWGPIRSTVGVSRMVVFGNHPAKADDALIALLKSHEQTLLTAPKRLFEQDEPVQLTEGPFRGIEGVYKMSDGESRAMVLIEFLSKPVSICVETASLRSLG